MTDPPVDSLVAAAGRGDEKAWSQLVNRYTPLVFSVINSFRLNWSDAADANQTVWLRLVEQLNRIREPQALPLWLVTTTRNECLRLLRSGRRTHPVDPLDAALDTALEATGPIVSTMVTDLDSGVEDRLLEAERHQMLRDGLRQVPSRCQRLLAMLVAEPPLSYEEISARMGIPVGSIGPTRARCLDKLRTCPAVVAFRDAVRAAETPGDERRDVAAVGR
jgi:RNA polymerase sigma factor (sigma-70 family)